MRILAHLCMILVPVLLPAAPYQFCFLEDGVNSGKLEKQQATELQAAHMKHINAMFAGGTLEVAGPIAGLPNTRGIFVFSGDPAAALELASQDPTVKAGTLKVSCQSWEGPAGIAREYRKLAAQPDFKNKMARKTVVILAKAPAQPPVKVIAAGALKNGYLIVLDDDNLEAARPLYPGATVFHWFHDVQVWIGVL